MKRNIFYIGLILVSMVMFSCNKQSFDYPDGKVGISSITQYPVFTLNGSQYVSVVKGGTYTDAGASAKEGSNTLTVKTASTVNTAAVGMYTVSYSATNKDGFEGTATRTVVVLPSAETPGVDISGKYGYAAGGATVTMTKLAAGFYYVGGIYSAATTIPAYLICVDGTNITVPLQSTAYGRLVGTAVLSGNTPGSTLNYTISLLDQGISNSVRKWLKQ